MSDEYKYTEADLLQAKLDQCTADMIEWHGADDGEYANYFHKTQSDLLEKINIYKEDH